MLGNLLRRQLIKALLPNKKTYDVCVPLFGFQCSCKRRELHCIWECGNTSDLHDLGAPFIWSFQPRRVNVIHFKASARFEYEYKFVNLYERKKPTMNRDMVEPSSIIAMMRLP